MLLHVIARYVAVGIGGAALRRRRDIRRHARVDAEHRLPAGAHAVYPLIAGTRIQRAVTEVPRVDVVDAELEIVVTALPLQTQAIVHDRFAMTGIGDRRVALRIRDAPGRNE